MCPFTSTRHCNKIHLPMASGVFEAEVELEPGHNVPDTFFVSARTWVRFDPRNLAASPVDFQIHVFSKLQGVLNPGSCPRGMAVGNIPQYQTCLVSGIVPIPGVGKRGVTLWYQEAQKSGIWRCESLTVMGFGLAGASTGCKPVVVTVPVHIIARLFKGSLDFIHNGQLECPGVSQIGTRGQGYHRLARKQGRQLPAVVCEFVEEKVRRDKVRVHPGTRASTVTTHAHTTKPGRFL